VVTRACVSVCLSVAACLHYFTDPDVTWRSGRGCPLVVHYWADLQSVLGLRCYGNTMEMHGRAQRCMQRAAKTPLTGDKIDEAAACAVPFHPYCGGVVTRTRNVSDYMPVLALCLVSTVLA